MLKFSKNWLIKCNKTSLEFFTKSSITYLFFWKTIPLPCLLNFQPVWIHDHIGAKTFVCRAYHTSIAYVFHNKELTFLDGAKQNFDRNWGRWETAGKKSLFCNVSPTSRYNMHFGWVKKTLTKHESRRKIISSDWFRKKNVHYGIPLLPIKEFN